MKLHPVPCLRTSPHTLIPSNKYRDSTLLLHSREGRHWLYCEIMVFLRNGRRYPIWERLILKVDRLCGLVVRVHGYKSKDPGFGSRHYHIFWEVEGLEWGPISLVRISEELLEWKSSGSGSIRSRLTVVGIRCADHATPSIRKSWH
jgi:hypothetical protein